MSRFENVSGLVFSIEEFAIYDGAGIRTCVFLAGCPLSCSWCHNPEGQPTKNYIVKSPNGCLHCGACEHFKNDGGYTEEAIGACPNHLLRYNSQLFTPAALAARLEKNLALINPSGGGITFSGGEPLLQHNFLFETLKLLKGKTDLRIETSGYAPDEVFRELLLLVDGLFFDIKLTDPAKHKRYTGADNAPILHNFRTLAGSGVPFTVRTPLIPGVTDTEENLTSIADLLASNGVKEIELMNYNRMAGAKYALCGRVFKPDYDDSVPCSVRTDIFAAKGISARVLR